MFVSLHVWQNGDPSPLKEMKLFEGMLCAGLVGGAEKCQREAPWSDFGSECDERIGLLM